MRFETAMKQARQYGLLCIRFAAEAEVPEWRGIAFPEPSYGETIPPCGVRFTEAGRRTFTLDYRCAVSGIEMIMTDWRVASEEQAEELRKNITRDRLLKAKEEIEQQLAELA